MTRSVRVIGCFALWIVGLHQLIWAAMLISNNGVWLIIVPILLSGFAAFYAGRKLAMKELFK